MSSARMNVLFLTGVNGANALRLVRNEIEDCHLYSETEHYLPMVLIVQVY